MNKPINLALSIVFFGFFVSIQSCNKDENTNQAHDIVYHVPEAYPGLDGEVVTFIINGDSLTCEKINDEYIFQGDIILTDYQLFHSDTTRGAGLPLGSQKWPNNTVYYEFDDDFPDPSRIDEAIAQIQDKTNVLFMERIDQNQANYILFIPTGEILSCSSYLGMKGGLQAIKISNEAKTPTVIHEICHALGLIHEHSRTDRNNYLNVNWLNIKPKYWSQYSKISTQYMTIPLDTNSIMIYPSYNYFAINIHKPTYTKKDGNPVGYKDKLSQGDIEVINMIYAEGQNITKPIVITSKPEDIIESTARLGGIVTGDGGANVIERGVFWGTSINPEQSGEKLAMGTGLGIFSQILSGLAVNKTYYVKAYATNSVGTAYGDEHSFTTALEIVADVDGNIYQPIQIGNQIWLNKNLNVTHYNNGEQIPNVTDQAGWWGLFTGAYVNYANDEANAITYGRLYNYFACTDVRNICPVGWHVPNNEEWQSLISYLGGTHIAGGKMKQIGTLEEGTGLWHSPNTYASNSDGFSALPGGYRNDWYEFEALGYSGNFWSTTISIANYSAFAVELSYNSPSVNLGAIRQQTGYSVRCIKD